MGELEHFLHEHKLILDEAEPVAGRDVECAACRQPINKLIDAFYRCNTSLIEGGPSSNCVGFFMHKSCSELPSTFTHPMKPQSPLSLLDFSYKKHRCFRCDVCEADSKGFMYASDNYDFYLCLKCVTSQLKSLEDRSRCHPGHDHPLTLVQSPALFLCHACNTTAIDLSYICTKCYFWIHKSCANAPTTYQSEFHNEHPLILDYSLPQEYRKFPVPCSVCNKIINCTYWVYYCANCRFFAHMKCASLTVMLSESDDDEADSEESNLMVFPAHDEASLDEMMQQCITMAALLHDSAASTADPSPNYINHLGHEHQLALGNKNIAKTSTPYLNWKLEDTELIICDGCTKPIFLVDDVFYECNSCKFFLHRSCAHFPKGIEHHLAGKMVGKKFKQFAIFKCEGCGILSNGMFMLNETTRFDIGCASLPRKIKHEGHHHPLSQVKYPGDYFNCSACACKLEVFEEKEATIMYGCEKCEICYYIHARCALRPHLVKHRWDQHPLYLILFVKNVTDHPHDFDCEFCSQLIDPNGWFYHCNACDLSFHIYCIDPYSWFSNVKLGATDIYSDSHPHPHGLTLVLSKNNRSCKICGEDATRMPVLQCSPCKYIVHYYCFIDY